MGYPPKNLVNRLILYEHLFKSLAFIAYNRLTGNVLTERGREAITADFSRILAQATQYDHNSQEQQNRLNWHIAFDFLDEKTQQNSRH